MVNIINCGLRHAIDTSVLVAGIIIQVQRVCVRDVAGLYLVPLKVKDQKCRCIKGVRSQGNLDSE